MIFDTFWGLRPYYEAFLEHVYAGLAPGRSSGVMLALVKAILPETNLVFTLEIQAGIFGVFAVRCSCLLLLFCIAIVAIGLALIVAAF